MPSWGLQGLARQGKLLNACMYDQSWSHYALDRIPVSNFSIAICKLVVKMHAVRSTRFSHKCCNMVGITMVVLL